MERNWSGSEEKKEKEQEEMNKDLLTWNEEKGLGFYPVKDALYDDFYFKASIANSESPLAPELTRCRINHVNTYTKGLILDFGAGCGQFLHARGNCLGYDICPQAVAWLQKEGLFFNPYEEDMDKRGIEAMTFFDSLEHLRDPEKILKRIKKQYVFISLPIFRDKAHVLASKHFKPREHYWYFAQRSIRAFMKECGFKFFDCLDYETVCGREDIQTFVFRREIN